MLGRLLRLAVIQEPRLAKAWNELADWSYQMGARVLEEALTRKNSTELTNDELRALDSVLPGCGDHARKMVQGVISQISLTTPIQCHINSDRSQLKRAIRNMLLVNAPS